MSTTMVVAAGDMCLPASDLLARDVRARIQSAASVRLVPSNLVLPDLALSKTDRLKTIRTARLHRAPASSISPSHAPF